MGTRHIRNTVGHSGKLAALAVVDMVKGVDRPAEIVSARITAKSGGRSGEWSRPADS